MDKLVRCVRAFGLTIIVVGASASTLTAQTLGPTEVPQMLPEPKLESPAPKHTSTASRRRPTEPQVFVPYTMEGPATGYSDNWFARATAWFTGGKSCGIMPVQTPCNVERTSFASLPSVVRRTDDVDAPSCGPTCSPSTERVHRRFTPSFDSIKIAGAWLSDALTRPKTIRSAKPRYVYKPPQHRACDKSYRFGPVQSECETPSPAPAIVPPATGPTPSGPVTPPPTAP